MVSDFLWNEEKEWREGKTQRESVCRREMVCECMKVNRGRGEGLLFHVLSSAVHLL